MHDKKTGLLMRAAVAMACHACPGLPAGHAAGLDRFAERIGLAFQVRDGRIAAVREYVDTLYAQRMLFDPREARG